MSDAHVMDLELTLRILGLVENDVTVLDSEGKILYTNRGWRGYDPETAIGLPIESFIAPAFHADHRRRMERAFGTLEADPFDVEFRRPDGASVWYRGTLVPVVRAGHPTVAVGVSRDVTLERRGEEATRVLETLLPLCAWCRRIKTDEGAWQSIDSYLEGKGGSGVTHSLCPQCETKMTPGESGVSAPP